MSPKNIIRAAILGIGAILIGDAQAQTTDTWNSTTSGLWGTAANWSGGVPSATSIATFNSAAGLQTSLTLIAASKAYSLSFLNTGGSSAYTFDTAATQNTNTLTLTAGMTNADASGVTFYNTTTLDAGQTWTNNGGALTFDGTVNLGSGSTGNVLTLAGSGAVNLNGVVANGGTAAGSIVMAGSGTLTLAAANTYTGSTTVSSGILSLTNSGALGTGSGTVAVASGATLELSNNITTTNTGAVTLKGTGASGALGALESLTGNNTIGGNISLSANATIYSATAGSLLTISATPGGNTFTLGSNTLTIDGPGNTWFNSNVGVSGDTGGLIKNGTGTLTFYGYDTYYTGATNVNAGTLDLVVGPFNTGFYGINGALTIGVGPANSSLADTVNVTILSDSYANQISPTSAVTINSDGALNVGQSTAMGTLTLNGGELNISSGMTATTGNVVSNANSAHETSTIAGGTLVSTTGSYNVAHDPTLSSDLTISSVVSGTNLTKTGAGVLTLSAVNTYTGTTTISAGTLQTNVNGALPSANALTIAGAGTLNINGTSQSVTGAFNSTGALNLGASGAFTLLGSASLAGTMSGTGTIILDAGSTLTLGANFNDSGINITLAGGTLKLNGTSDTFGNLSVTSSSIIDFANPTASVLTINNVTVTAGQTLTVKNWANMVDYFYSLTNPGSALSQIAFTGVSGTVHWNSYTDGPDNLHEISPVPEPATYGAIFVGISLVGLVAIRSRRRPCPVSSR